MNYLRNTLGLADEHLPGMLTNYWDRRETVMGHFPASRTSLTQASRFFAERTGYGEPTNFTAAFKRHFAALPREVRGSRKRIQDQLPSVPGPLRR
jgi:hypothetical protein